MRTKTHLLYQNTLSTHYDIIILTESWLHEAILDSELCNNIYDVFRCDRDQKLTGKSKGGGVLIMVRKTLQAYTRDDYLCSPAEALWITIPSRTFKSAVRHNLHLCSTYIAAGPHHIRDIDIVHQSLKSLLTSNPLDHIVLIGDFNLPNIQWLNNNPIYLHRGTADLRNASSNFINDLSLLGFNQYNHILNSHDNILDLVFCNFSIDLQRSNSPLLHEEGVHPSLELELQNLIINPLPMSVNNSNNFIYKYRKGDYENIRKAINDIDWSALGYEITIDSAVSSFYNSLNSIIHKYVPKGPLSKNLYPRWFSPALIKIIKEKNKAHKRWKKYNNPIDFEVFSLLRSRQKRFQMHCYKSYTYSMQSLIKKDPKKFWSFVKSRKGGADYPSEFISEGNIINDGQSICDTFNNFFASVFSNPAGHYVLDVLAPPFCDSDDHIHKICVNEIQVLNVLKGLDSSGGPGSDGIAPFFIRECCLELCTPLTILFNRSLSDGILPHIWKEAHIIPIFKKGLKTKVENYRPISILNIFSKVLEKLVYNNIYQLIVRGIPSAQHGFVKGRSTTTNLTEFVSFVTSSMDKGSQVDVIYTDFEKAFDRVDHTILLHKLHCLGIRGNLYRWVCSYLSNRSQIVCLGSYRSNSVTIPSVIPQGSHLGPLFYNAYLYDIYKFIQNSKYLMYADDTKIFLNINNPTDCQKLQTDLDSLYNYYNLNRINVNTSKCAHITFSRNKKLIEFSYNIGGKVLEKVDIVNDLGVSLDNKLTYRQHIDAIVNKAYRNLGFVMRVCSPFSDIHCVKIVYYAYVRSVLEYASSIWSPHYVIYKEKIERIQSIFIKHLNHRNKIICTDYTESCKKHCIFSLESRRQILDIIFLYKLINGSMDCSELINQITIRTPCRRTRVTARALFNTPTCSTNYAQYSTLPRIARLYNDIFIDIDIFGGSRQAFRSALLNKLKSVT